jgi:hypothetical protein
VIKKTELVERILSFEEDGWELKDLIEMARYFRRKELKSFTKTDLIELAVDEYGMEID